MIQKLAIVAGEPNSISSEIIFKTWKLRKKFKHKPFFIIGSLNLLNQQKKKLNYNFKIKKINKNFTNLNKNYLSVYDVTYKQNKAFKKISSKSNDYIIKCFEIAVDLAKKNKIQGIINCPIAKKYLLRSKYNGITEFLAEKFKVKGEEVMLLFNKQLSVSPITTHIPFKKVVKELSVQKIVKKIKIVNNFYKIKLKKRPVIGVLGLNPHNYSGLSSSEENKIISPAIKLLQKKNIKVHGPIPTDSSFSIYKKLKLNIIIGMYHDQVLTTFKSLFGYNAVNVTLGLPIIRNSPDHGIAEDIVGKKKANATSLVEAIKFFNYVK